MRDVSRVEYDAALKRFLDAFDAHMVSSVSRRTFGPMVEARRALAALGLDEPPTEKKPFDVRDHPMAFPSHVDEPPTGTTAHNGIPDDFWRDVPCGHPPDPVAARVDHGWTCHCGGGLDPKDAISDGTVEGAPGPIVACGKCGCYVATPLGEEWRLEALREAREVAAVLLAAPPAEPPKACPTCKGDGAFFDCDACNGSGIDGGTTGGADV